MSSQEIIKEAVNSIKASCPIDSSNEDEISKLVSKIGVNGICIVIVFLITTVRSVVSIKCKQNLCTEEMTEETLKIALKECIDLLVNNVNEKHAINKEEMMLILREAMPFII